ncbi:polysaccharide lyase family 7 protein [Neiella marina]|uniref:Polysaccharide lyase family 7 protein n=1 Tax=Neiella holothuriorum TaxID=2870530 RepID=A0ABS7ECE7_9GAMM|nr:polysaccharide lyase family 7 protein [Neiella holothuriorum]MBW8189521.1 polysaccharide lyase family 7 protein [Neiella holothuriorum]
MKPLSTSLLTVATLSLAACGGQKSAEQTANSAVQPKAEVPVVEVALPADKFDLSHWKIAVPTDVDGDGKVDEIDVAELQSYSHPDYFYLNSDGNLVFAAPNKAITTANSSNTRSELHQMYRGTDTSIDTYDPANNFGLAAHPTPEAFAAIGGRMEATLKVDHVSENAKYADKNPAYSVVIGQIHAGKDAELVAQGEGYGWGNEPLKIYYKKWPHHDTGSVFWNYELNLEKENPKRRDISHVVWGNDWGNSADPGASGLALGDEISYVVNVYENVMKLTFTAEGKEPVEFTINLTDNVDAYGEVNPDDHPHGYSGDTLFFKAGAYNQCSTKDDPGFWYAACPGTGDWETDKANGDYVQVTFSKIELSKPEPIE